jgi:hypothetical protein
LDAFPALQRGLVGAYLQQFESFQLVQAGVVLALQQVLLVVVAGTHKTCAEQVDKFQLGRGLDSFAALQQVLAMGSHRA